MTDSISLDQIAARLEALEETIIMRFIDRAQFAANSVAYERGRSGFSGAGDRSLFEVRLEAQERMDAEFGRYEVPEERPVNATLPAPRRTVHLPPSPLQISDYSIVSQSPAIRDAYLGCLSELCAAGDDGQYGSSVELDVYAIQAIARRVHFGALYVAEAKYRSNPVAYHEAAGSRDTERLTAMLTRSEVEQRIIDRLEKKVAYLQQHVNTDVRRVIGAEVIVTFYRKSVIPLTKRGQVAYLLNRR